MDGREHRCLGRPRVVRPPGMGTQEGNTGRSGSSELRARPGHRRPKGLWYFPDITVFQCYQTNFFLYLISISILLHQLKLWAAAHPRIKYSLFAVDMVVRFAVLSTNIAAVLNCTWFLFANPEARYALQPAAEHAYIHRQSISSNVGLICQLNNK
jgi:hypothetical protein